MHPPDADIIVGDALDAAAVPGAVRSAAPDVIVHMLTAIPDPIDPKHLAGPTCCEPKPPLTCSPLPTGLG